MGLSQGRLSDANGGKRGKKSGAGGANGANKGATPVKATPTNTLLDPHHHLHHHNHNHHHEHDATPNNNNGLTRPVLGRAVSGPSSPAAPAAVTLAAPAVPPAQQHPATPSYDENSHPFHAPLDHVREEERPLHELSATTHFDVATLRKLQVIFTDIAESDVDDGIIDGNELTDAMGLKSSCLLARTIFRIFDITHQKKIDFAQWVRTISALSVRASLEEKIRFSFLLYDLNGDGSIDVEELRAMLEAAVKDENVLHLSDAEVREWCDHTLSQVDGNGDGKVDYEEYRSMVQNSVKFIESFTLDIHELCQSFRFKQRRSSEKMTAHEVDQRLLWFRARQRQYSASNSTHSSQDQSQDGSQHGSSAETPNTRGAKTPTPGGLGSGHRGGSSARGGSGRGGSGRNQKAVLGGSGIHKPIDVASHSSPSGVAFANNTPASAAATHANLAPPSIATSSPSLPIQTGGGVVGGGPVDHLQVHLSHLNTHATPTPNTSSDVATPVFHSDTASSAASASPAPNSAASHSGYDAMQRAHSLESGIAAAAEPASSSSSTPVRHRGMSHEQEVLLRQHSAPQRSGPPSLHYVASHTPPHLLRQASMTQPQDEDNEIVEQVTESD